MKVPQFLSIRALSVPNISNSPPLSGGAVAHPAFALSSSYTAVHSLNPLDVLLMGSADRKLRRRGARRPRAAGSVTTPPPPLNEPPQPPSKERGWISKFLSRNPVSRFLLKLLWNPENVHLEKSPWESMGEGVSPSTSFFAHGRNNPVSVRLAEIIKTFVTDKHRRTFGDDLIVELGSGDGSLAAYVGQHVGARVHEVDLVDNPSRGTDGRTIADIRNLDMFNDGQFLTVLSSFALEYTGVDGFKEAFRILAPGGKLILLVHHKDSSIGLSGVRGVLLDGAIGLYKILASFRPTHFLLSFCSFLERALGDSVRVGLQLKRCAFANQHSLKEMLKEAGFTGIPTVETAYVPLIVKMMMGRTGGKQYDSGWIVTVKKPSRRT